ncbi:MAG TPA: IS1595 family transposase [Phycisphaerales bacterium]|nr:IS1595 family transposase [Phycisphaerales bacterium]
MRNSVAVPTTLAGAIKYFANKDIAHEFLASLRWPEGPFCPRCACTEYSYLTTRRVYKCKGCQKQYTVKLGTIFEDSPIGLDKWLPAVWLIVNAKNGISSYELHRSLGVTQKTAWFMLHRIRLAMQTQTFAKVSGDVEVDETYIGGKARFMHPDKKDRIMKGRRGGVTGKAAVMGLLSRDERKGHSKVRVEVLPEGRSRVKREDAKKFVETNVEVGANLFTDEHKSYIQMRKHYIHQVIDHGTMYAKGKVHINGMENFWSLLKRGIRGTYVSVEPFHLFRYLDEQVFRFNTRKTKDVARFIMTLGQFVNKRLTYAELIGENTTGATA